VAVRSKAVPILAPVLGAADLALLAAVAIGIANRTQRIALLTLAVCLLAAALPMASTARAAPSLKKAIWGPEKVDGRSQFPIYRDLGVGIYQGKLNWNAIAPNRPDRPTDPADPAYRWPKELPFVIREARRYGIRVALQIIYAPPWANGGRSREWAPRPRAFARFATAAARRYRSVRHWMVWGEPSAQRNFRPMPYQRPAGPRRYSRILDAAYGALKRVRRRNLVIGGNTFTSGDVRPRRFIKSMRLPDGRPPRMDMYGHNPFTTRRPALWRPYVGYGFADYSDLDTLAGWVDHYLGRRRARPIKLFLSEFTVPSDHANAIFNFHVSRRRQAEWLGAALRISRRWDRIYTLGWFSLYDQPPNGPGGTPGTEANWGLLDWRGRPKPAYHAFKRG
jgi:hypothetical protein